MRQVVFRIEKSIKFDASHQLRDLPDGHPCGRMHGHTYTVCVVVEGSEPADSGMLIDFAIISNVVKDRFDHQHLNDRMRAPPTAENIAWAIAQMVMAVIFTEGREKFCSVKSVSVQEGTGGTATVIVTDTEESDATGS